VLDMSWRLADELAEKKTVDIAIDLLPGLDDRRWMGDTGCLSAAAEEGRARTADDVVARSVAGRCAGWRT